MKFLINKCWKYFNGYDWVYFSNKPFGTLLSLNNGYISDIDFVSAPVKKKEEFIICDKTFTLNFEQYSLNHVTKDLATFFLCFATYETYPWIEDQILFKIRNKKSIAEFMSIVERYDIPVVSMQMNNFDCNIIINNPLVSFVLRTGIIPASWYKLSIKFYKDFISQLPSMQSRGKGFHENSILFTMFCMAVGGMRSVKYNAGRFEYISYDEKISCSFDLELHVSSEKIALFIWTGNNILKLGGYHNE